MQVDAVSPRTRVRAPRAGDGAQLGPWRSGCRVQAPSPQGCPPSRQPRGRTRSLLEGGTGSSRPARRH